MNQLKYYEKSRHTSSGIRFVGIQQSNFFHLHWHEHLEFHFMIRGSIKVQCGGQMLNVKEHDFLIVNSNELHKSSDLSKCECFIIKIHPSFFDHKHYTFDNLIHDETIISLMFQIIDLYQNIDDASLFLVKGYVFQLMGYLCSHYATKTTSLGAQQQNNEKLQKMNTIAGFLHEHYATKISTQDLVQMSHYNYSHFCHTFKEVFGMSVNRYLLNIRINKASALLTSTDMNITEIATTSGFSDVNYFARVFKKETGLSPTKYRGKFHANP